LCEDKEFGQGGQRASEYLSYIETELRIEWDRIKERRIRQVQYLRTYMVALGALLATGAYGIDSSKFLDAGDKIAYGVFGLVVWGIVLAGGCCFTIFLGHNFRGYIIAMKNIVALRKAANVKIGFCSETDPRDVRISQAYNTGHYWMAVLNSAVALGCIHFLKYITDSWIVGTEIGLLVLSLAVFFYPRVCIGFNRYMIIANRVRPGWPESRAWEAYQRFKERRKRARRLLGKNARDLLVIVYWVFAVILFGGVTADVSFWYLEIYSGLSAYIVWCCVCLFLVLIVLRLMQLRYEYFIIRKRRPSHFVK